VLVGLAVVIGIVLLQVVDKGAPVGGGGGNTPVTKPGDETTTTKPSDVRPPQEVRVLVLNGSGVSQAAATKANQLRGLGYAIAGTGNAAVQQGTNVQCRAGFENEADELAKTVGAGTLVVPFPEPPPAGSENADCIVVLGK
jgi:hypothetical protein